MELIRRHSGLRPRHRPCVATIGAFDGVHRGHRAVIEQLKAAARALALPSTIITFEPLPREFLQPESAPARLTPLRERFEQIAACGIDALLCLPFNEDLRRTSAGDFADDILVRGLGVRSLILGDDFRFGRERDGDLEFMKALGKEHGFDVASTATVEFAGARISSSRIRALLAEGDFAGAEQLLGRPFAIGGRVMHGRAMGREIGAPTANIGLRRLLSPIYGVFAARVHGAGLDGAAAVANIGRRPTVDDGRGHNLEVHLLDRDVDLYGQRLQVVPRRKLRPEQRFASVDELRAQIAVDMAQARKYFAAREGDLTGA